MAYTEQQHQEHIFELQTYLHGLAHFYDLPAVTPDGVYGENTASAVREFQQKNSLRPTGVTNTATWNAIVQAYLTDTAPPTASFSIFPDGIFAYTLGDQNSGVYLIQGLLQAIRKQFLFSLPVLACSGTYDTATQQAVQAFQKHTGLPVTGVVNPATWNHMLAIFQSTLDAQAFPQYQHFPE